MPSTTQQLGLGLLLMLLLACGDGGRMGMKARLGSTKSMREYGMWLWRQPNSSQDQVAEGTMWIRKAADKGDVEAMFEMGRIKEVGGGVRPEAVYWYRKAAEAGDFAGMTKLIEIYRYGGFGFPPDLVEARKWEDAAYAKYRADKLQGGHDKK